MESTKWTEEENLFLLNNIQELGVDRIAKKLKRPSGVIYYRLKQEGIDVEEVSWSKIEVKELKSLYPISSNIKVSQTMNRSPEAIQWKAKELDLRKTFWMSEEDLLLLKEMAIEGLSPSKIAKVLERPTKVVRQKLDKAKLLHEERVWGEYEFDMIGQMALSGDYTLSQIAKYIEATPQQIKKICKENGWFDKIKRTASSGNEKIAVLLRKIFPIYQIEKEYPIGERLRLDIYLPDLRLGIEYDGIQHFRYTPIWHGSKNKFSEAQERDRRKEELCLLKNITLIRIKHDEELSVELLQSKIAQAISEAIIPNKPSQQKRSKQKIKSNGFPKQIKHKWPTKQIPSRKLITKQTNEEKSNGEN